jgi:hypothetical protein
MVLPPITLFSSLFGGRCEEKQEEDVRVCQLGNFVARNKEQISKVRFFAVFLQCTGLEIWIFPRSPAIFRRPKNSRNADFSAVSQDFEGQACSKNLRGFPAMNRFQSLDFFVVSRDFLGDPKNSQNADLSAGRMSASKNFRNLNFSAVVLGF